ncbi:MAG: DUF2169 domain-containing protein [Desulfobacula sp.]|uniref:DUF2169 family type VI secretion system accessory protein n=1 Tax=Desulfobacula sp. TaxID=2593537 RepID=UPI0025BAB517|nr:DUF2169 domain-containing protein [Desulfobacula sp.]MCD4721616.1 DUF2169 domain-containing protein [Desulfobacula sp.]
MKLEHITGMEAGYTMGMNHDGRELLVVCVKGTFTIPKNGSEPVLAKEQIPLFEADEFSGEPGISAPLHESDYAPHKPFCDVLLNGSAYAPKGKPAVKVPVSLQIGPISKSFNVVGHRVWKNGLLSFKAGRPQRFEVMPFSYDTAFGGVDSNHTNPKKHEACMQNPVGLGFHSFLKSEFIKGKSLPNTERPGKSVSKPNGKYEPLSFGPVGRGWQPRYPLAGTYDQNWVDNFFPFLPADFNEAYFQAAPEDQQMPYPKGGEVVGLLNLTPEGRTIFRLPAKSMVVTFFLKNNKKKDIPAMLDTIMIEPDNGFFTLTWRASLFLKKNMLEVELALIAESKEDR